MNKLTIPVFLTAFLFGLFIFGILTQQVFAMMSAFCLWTPCAWFLGYRIARAGIRINVSMGEAKRNPIPEIVPKQRRRRESPQIINEFQE